MQTYVLRLHQGNEHTGNRDRQQAVCLMYIAGLDSLGHGQAGWVIPLKPGKGQGHCVSAEHKKKPCLFIIVYRALNWIKINIYRLIKLFQTFLFVNRYICVCKQSIYSGIIGLKFLYNVARLLDMLAWEVPESPFIKCLFSRKVAAGLFNL